MPDKDERYNPIRKYAFPAGVGGGEIRINIPVYASKEEVQTAMEAMQVIAERWKEAE